jgi:glycosyltransferase involved in cell wall biosynthesis
MRIAFVYYASFSSFIKRDYDIISRVHEVKKVNFSGPGDAVKLMEAVANCDLALIWFAGGHAFAAVLLAKLLRKKSMIIVGGFDVARVPEINYGRFTQSWTKKFLTKKALQHADRVLVVDPSLKRDAIKNAGIDGHNIDYLPTGYDYEKFVPGPAKENLVITVSLGESCSRVPLKGLHTFVKSAKQLPEAKFLIVGMRGEALAFLKSMASENVEFKEPLSTEKLIEYYQKAKCYCQLSLREGLPNALCEAMLCECIPVGTDRNGIPTAMGDTGFLVPYGDAKATAIAIANALKAPCIRGQNARNRIREIFPEKRRERGLLQAIEEIAGT